ncbi:hypothetical protein [Lacticaseibacillus suihuaensis]
MSNRNGAKKLYKAHKTWIAAGVAAATLLSVQALGGQQVSAAAGDTTTTAQAAVTKADLLATIQKAKQAVSQYGVGNQTDPATGKSFYGDFDAVSGQVNSGAITPRVPNWSLR